MKFYSCTFIFLIINFGVFVENANSQQTVFNVPTADVLDKGKVYVELDASLKPNNQNALNRFSSFVPRIVAGTGGNTEVGLNLTGNVQPGTDATTLVPNFKWKIYQNENKNLAVYGGNNFYIPVRNRGYKFGTYTYLAMAKTINKTRLTAGGYVYSKNVVAPNASRGGGQFAIEQTINSKVGLAADWITGKHSNGYITPGFVYKPHPKVTTYWSYSIGNANARQGNHYFLIELGINLN